ncbi:MAG: sialidase family protein [Planctomycetota bacterium]
MSRQYYIIRFCCLIAIVALLLIQGCSSFSNANAQIINLNDIQSPIILKGDENRAFRDPAAIYHNGTFYLYYTLWLKDADGIRYSYTALSKSKDLAKWTEPKIITPKDINLNYSSPGNVIRFKDKWILCLQTYPTPDGKKYGNNNCRLWIMRSDDLENWAEPEMLKVKGPDVPFDKMGRLIDAYLVEDKDTPGKWWCLFDDNAVNISYSYDLEKWTYLKRVPAGENACVIIKDNEYILFHSPGNGIGVKRSKNMIDWNHVGTKIDKSGTGSITLGQKDWPWSSQRLTAGFVLDLKDDPLVGKYLMFFHAEPPGGFKKLASLGIAWSDDLVTWDWPGKK